MSSVAGSCRRSLHRRKYSDEIDVFEAARYFSDYYDDAVSISQSHTAAVPDHHDSCSTGNNNYAAGLEKKQKMKEILNKSRRSSHPSSPGGRIASFLNSLFSQSPSKKNKSTAKSDGGDTWKRRRRSSISHFQSSSSRTTTPTPYVTTPATASKSLKEFKTYFDQKQSGARKRSMDRNFRKFEVDDGAESDSSSDLFELQNYDLGFVSSDELPVYETTRIDSIKRSGTISNAAS